LITWIKPNEVMFKRHKTETLKLTIHQHIEKINEGDPKLVCLLKSRQKYVYHGINVLCRHTISKGSRTGANGDKEILSSVSFLSNLTCSSF